MQIVRRSFESNLLAFLNLLEPERSNSSVAGFVRTQNSYSFEAEFSKLRILTNSATCGEFCYDRLNMIRRQLRNFAVLFQWKQLKLGMKMRLA